MLTPDQITDIVFFFNDYEATIGIHSLFSAMVERAALYYTEDKMDPFYNGPMPRATANPSYTMDLLPLCWSRNIHDKQGGKIARGRRVRNTLIEMIENDESHHVTVLYRLYGPPPPNVDWHLYPEPSLAPLAGLTSAFQRYAGTLESLAFNDPLREEYFDLIMEEAAELKQTAEDSYRRAALSCEVMKSMVY